MRHNEGADLSEHPVVTRVSTTDFQEVAASGGLDKRARRGVLRVLGAKMASLILKTL